MKKNTNKANDKVATGGLHDSVGFAPFKGEGYVQSLDEQLKSIRANGFEVEETPSGILITPVV